MWDLRVALMSVSVALSRHKLTLQNHGYGASAPYGVPVYVPAFAGTKLYCLVTEARGCEQLAQGCYTTMQRPGLKSATTKSIV